jgi:uncharacterized protein involved in exopolysaccharide biosynthesis
MHDSVKRHPDRSPRRGPVVADAHLGLDAFLAAIFRRWVLVVLPVLAALAGLGLYFAFAPKEYTSTAQILIDIQKPRVIGDDAVVSGLDTTRYMIGPVIDSQVEILLSTRIAERVVRATGLHEDPDYTDADGLVDRLMDSIGIGWLLGRGGTEAPAGGERPGDASERSRVESAITAFQRRLDVRRKGVTLILYVRYTDEDPVRAAELANATAEAYIADQRESRLQAARDTIELLNQQVSELREQVIEGEQRLQEYSASNNLLSVGGMTVSERQISETVSQLILARADGASRRAELEQVESLASDPDAAASISGVLQSEVIRDLRRQESEVRRKLVAVSNQFGARDGQADAARAELEDVSSEITREVKRIVRNARNHHEVAQSRIRFLESSLASMTEEFARRNKMFLQQAQLDREVKATRDLYLTLLTRLKETTVQESLLYPDARVIDGAPVPRKPSGPRKLILIALALLGGLFVGVTLAVMREHFAGPRREPAADPRPPVRRAARKKAAVPE